MCSIPVFIGAFHYGIHDVEIEFLDNGIIQYSCSRKKERAANLVAINLIFRTAKSITLKSLQKFFSKKNNQGFPLGYAH